MQEGTNQIVVQLGQKIGVDLKKQDISTSYHLPTRVNANKEWATFLPAIMWNLGARIFENLGFYHKIKLFRRRIIKNGTGGDSVVVKHWTRITDSELLACELITAKMNSGWQPLNERAENTASVHCLSPCVRILSRVEKILQLYALYAKKRFKSNPCMQTRPAHSFLADIKQYFGSKVVVDRDSHICSTCIAAISKPKKTGETLKHTSTPVYLNLKNI